MRADTGVRLHPVFAEAVEAAQRSLAAPLAPTRLAAEVETGRSASRESAFALATADAARPRTAVAVPAQAAGELGQRQAEVARLVAEGLTNRQIGARLFISAYTVDSHVRAILNKVGFTSRSQIAAWVSDPDRCP